MLKILQYEISSCEICKSEYTKENKPLILNCGNTLCNNCLKNLLKTKENKCPFNKEHIHKKDEKFPVNYSFFDIVSGLNDAINVINEQIKKGDKKDNKISLIQNLSKMPNNSKYTCDEFEFIGNLDKKNKPNGGGKLIHKKLNFEINANFNGEFNKGYGIIKYSNGDMYHGFFDNFKKNGKGDLIFKNGDKFHGQFKNDFFEGEGILTKKNEKKIIKGFF